MKKYYYILVFALSVFISACNQSPIEEGISKNIEKKQKETHYSFDMNVGFGGGKLDDPSLINDLRSLSYNIDGRAWTIEGREELPEKDLNAIVYIKSAAGEGEILTAGTTIFKKVPGENKFYCDKITFPLEPNFTDIYDLKIENDSIKFKCRYNPEYGYYDLKLKHIYVNAVFSYNPIEETKDYMLSTEWVNYSLWGSTYDNIKALYTKKNNEYNIDVPFIMENVKIEVKDGKLKVAEGEKPVMRPLGSLLFIKINNKADKDIRFYLKRWYRSYINNDISLHDKVGARIRVSMNSTKNIEGKKIYTRKEIEFFNIKSSNAGIDYKIDSIFGDYKGLPTIELKRGKSTRNYLLYFLGNPSGKKLEINIVSRKLSREHTHWIQNDTKWESNFPVAHGTIYKANIDIDF